MLYLGQEFDFLNLVAYSVNVLFVSTTAALYISSFIMFYAIIFIPIFIHSLIRSFIHSFALYSFIYLFIHSFIHPSIHPFVHLFIHSSQLMSSLRPITIYYSWHDSQLNKRYNDQQ